MGPIRNPRWEQKRIEGYVIVSSLKRASTKVKIEKEDKYPTDTPWVQQIAVSTLAFNMHLFNFSLFDIL
jgi:hypothetical protein